MSFLTPRGLKIRLDAETVYRLANEIDPIYFPKNKESIFSRTCELTEGWDSLPILSFRCTLIVGIFFFNSLLYGFLLAFIGYYVAFFIKQNFNVSKSLLDIMWIFKNKNFLYVIAAITLFLFIGSKSLYMPISFAVLTLFCYFVSLFNPLAIIDMVFEAPMYKKHGYFPSEKIFMDTFIEEAKKINIYLSYNDFSPAY